MRYLVLAVVLMSCGSPQTTTVDGVSRSEAQALNDAAEMLDANAAVPVAGENVTSAR